MAFRLTVELVHELTSAQCVRAHTCVSHFADFPAAAVGTGLCHGRDSFDLDATRQADSAALSGLVPGNRTCRGRRPACDQDAAELPHFNRRSSNCSRRLICPSPVLLQCARTPLRRSRQCWYWNIRASGMNRIRSSGQPVSAAMANTWAARKPGSSHGGAFFRRFRPRDPLAPPPVHGFVPPTA
jgi:hypothetical protein